MISVKFSGTKAFSKLAKTTASLKLGEEFAKEMAGKKLKAEMKRTIDKEMVNWPALSPVTVSRKGNDKILVETSEMRDSIDFKDHGKYITIGVHEDAPNNRSLIALIHEHGAPDANIPARPFIQPTWDREKREIIKVFDRSLKKFL
jgi:phage gpG-like protein